MKRSSGILMPISSLPSPFGIGTLGKEAYEFIDFLAEAGQKYWQILPVNPTGFGDSPYQSLSAFAFNPYFIDLQILADRDLITRKELEKEKKADTPGTIDYGRLFETRQELLEKAAERMPPADEYFEHFKAENAYWLREYALFTALRKENKYEDVTSWPMPLKNREEAAMAESTDRLAEQIHKTEVIQFFFWQQWCEVKQYAGEKGIEIIGDVPMYVAQNSVDFWSQRDIFQVDEKGDVSAVSGLPPDGFAPAGQKWGTPLYNWDAHKKSGYDWWIRRLKHAFQLYDVVRIDHFRGFAGYYAIPAEHKDAARGTWHEGPRMDIIRSIKKAIPQIAEAHPGPTEIGSKGQKPSGKLKIIAEDLGAITADVRDLIFESGFPGMKILQFAFDDREWSEFLPHNYPKNSVVYTGNHDNATTKEWFATAPAEYIEYAGEYLGLSRREPYPVRTFIKKALETVSEVAIIPLADWLDLGEEARINIPGKLNGWRWRLDGRDGTNTTLSPQIADEIRACTKMYGRL